MPGVVDTFKGAWTEDSVENFDNFMKALDVNFVLRKVGNNTKANEEWIVDGDKITVKFTSTFKNKTLEFTLGNEIDEETMDGRKVKTTFTEENGKLVHSQVGKPHNCRYTREIQGDLLVVTMTVLADTEVTAVRKFKKV